MLNLKTSLPSHNMEPELLIDDSATAVLHDIPFDLDVEIQRLKKELNAVILAHYYQ